MTKEKYSQDRIRKILVDKGLSVVGDIGTTNDKVHCVTCDGYHVMALPSGIIRRNDNPSVFSKYNPYTIQNIRQWLVNQDVCLKLVSEQYVSSTDKMVWTCSCGVNFDASWNDVLNGKKSCNYCAHSKRYDGYQDYHEIILCECEKYDYELLTTIIPRANSRFEYICSKHREYGVQHSTYDNMINGGKHCKYCGIERRGIKRRYDENAIRWLVEQKGFIYCGVEYGNYKNERRKKVRILFKCKKHEHKGVQVIDLSNLKNSNGRCAYCVGKYRTKEDLQNEVNQLGSNITVLDYVDYGSPIQVRCDKCGREWTTTGVSLTQGVGCANCNKSRFEKEVNAILDQHAIISIPQYRFQDCRDINPLPFDFYLPDYNILIEVDGEGHYMPIRRSSTMTDEDAEKSLREIQRHDSIKTEYCKQNGIKLIRIPYWERNNLDSYILKNVG